MSIIVLARILCLFCSLLMMNTFSSAEPFQVAALEGSSNSAPVKTLMTEVYQRLGIEFETSYYPARRSLMLTNRGVADAELQRIGGLEQSYPNLVRVPTSVGSFYAAAFTRGLQFPIEGWQSIKPYRLGIVGGVKFAEAGTKGMDVSVADDMEMLIKMLDGNRIDVAIISLHTGLDVIKQLGFQNISVLKPMIDEYPLYHYLHRKHALLVPKIDEQIRILKAQGRFEEIWPSYWGTDSQHN